MLANWVGADWQPAVQAKDAILMYPGKRTLFKLAFAGQRSGVRTPHCSQLMTTVERSSLHIE